MSSSSSSSSSSSTAAASSAAIGVHMKRLRDAHARTLGVWKGLITANPSEHALTEAFMKFLEEFPDAKKRVSGPNPDATMLSLCVHRLFPSLASTAPEIVVRIITDLMGVMIANTQEELSTIIDERALQAKFAELDKLIEDAEKKGAEARPAPLEVLPEDEHRSHAMDVKLAYEKQLQKLLESMRRETEALDSEVSAMDSRARVIKASVDSKVAAIDALVVVAESHLSAMGAGSGGAVTETAVTGEEVPGKTSRSASAKKR